MLVLPATRDVLRGYLDYVADAPDDLTTIANLMHAPPAPFIPEDRVGELVLMIFAVWTGDIEEGERAFAPLRALAEPVADVIAPMPYPVIYQFTADAGAAARRRHPLDVRRRPQRRDDRRHPRRDERPGGPISIVQFRGLGGAFARVAEDETAFAHRDRRFFTTALGLWLDPDEDAQPHRDWTNRLWDKIRRDADGVYVNFLHDEGEQRIRDAYPGGTYERLVRRQAAVRPEQHVLLQPEHPPAQLARERANTRKAPAITPGPFPLPNISAPSALLR